MVLGSLRILSNRLLRRLALKSKCSAVTDILLDNSFQQLIDEVYHSLFQSKLTSDTAKAEQDDSNFMVMNFFVSYAEFHRLLLSTPLRFPLYLHHRRIRA